MNNDEKPCPICAETIKAAALRCRFCQADLHAISGMQDAETEKMLFAGNPKALFTVWQSIICGVTLGLAYIFFRTKSIAIRYEITSQRIRIERGIFSRVKSSVELFNIEHFNIESPLGMRLLGYCILHLRSSDPDVPLLTLYGIENLESLADLLRECSLRERARRKVLAVMRP